MWRSVKGFGRGNGSNFPFSHWLASSPLQHSRTTVRVCDVIVHSSIGNGLSVHRSSSFAVAASGRYGKMSHFIVWIFHFLRNMYTDYEAVIRVFRSRNALLNKLRKVKLSLGGATSENKTWQNWRKRVKKSLCTRLLSCYNCVGFKVMLMIFSFRIILPLTRKCFDTVGRATGRASDL